MSGSLRGQRSALVSRFGEGAQLLGVDVPQLLQLSLSSSVQILDVHHVRLLDLSVLSELVTDSRDEARFVPAGPQELPVQSQDLLLQLTVPSHPDSNRPQIRDDRKLEDTLDSSAGVSSAAVSLTDCVA